MDGIIVIDKPAGFTSHDVVAKLRGILHQKRIGHTGTLDPDATGVLPVLLGRATKLSEMLTAHEKVYEAVMLLGVTTDTQDMSGSVLARRGVNTGEDELHLACGHFTGDIEQIPPMYSAIKVGGKKLCDLAREGKEVDRKPRAVRIEEISVMRIELPRVYMRVRCSKGTYIRTLCNDIGEYLGCGAAMETLRRTASGDFTLAHSLTLEEVQKAADTAGSAALGGGDCPDGASPAGSSVEELLGERFITIENALSFLPRFTVPHRYDKPLLNGNALLPEWGEGETDPGQVAVFDEEGCAVGIYSLKKGRLSPDVMLRTSM